jgi:uncharacterized membrane protein
MSGFPKPEARRRFIRVYIAVLAGILVWLGAVVAAPLLKNAGHPFFRRVYACFAPVCHQNPARSFLIGGSPLAVCARCFGIYAGFLAGMIAYPFLRGFDSIRPPGAVILIVLTFPLGIDGLANFLGVWNTPDALRFVIGAAWGSVLPFFLLAGLGELALRKLAFPPLKK